MPVFMLLMALAAESQSVPSSVDKFLKNYGLPANPFGATVFSLLYGAPLASWAREVYSSGLLSTYGANKPHTIGTLASPDTSIFVVKTNVDMVYATVIFDISSVDLAINVPPFEAERFYVFAFFDP